MTTANLDLPVKASSLRNVSLGRRLKNHVARMLFLSSFAIALVPLIWLLWVVVARGLYAITQPGWWSHSLRGVLPEQFSGGVYHALFGTLVQSGMAAIIAVPLGFMTAVYLAEYQSSRLARITTFIVDVLAGLPSIVAALFIFSLWIATLGFQQSAFAVSLALVLLMLPVVVRSSEEMLKLVPNDLREASYALGVSKWKTIMRIVVPIAMPGIVSGVLLAIARVMGETAPVLVLVGYSRSINFNLFEGNMASLPLLIYTELDNPEHAGFLRVWGAALTLIIVVAVVYLVAAAAGRIMTVRRRGSWLNKPAAQLLRASGSEKLDHSVVAAVGHIHIVIFVECELQRRVQAVERQRSRRGRAGGQFQHLIVVVLADKDVARGVHDDAPRHADSTERQHDLFA